MNTKNKRLGKALSAAKKHGAKRRYYHFCDRKAAKAASMKSAAMRKTITTRTMRIQSDAIELAKSAWTTPNVRVNETSEAIRTAARRALGVK